MCQRSRITNYGKKSRCSIVSSALAHASRRKWQRSDHGNWAVTRGVLCQEYYGYTHVHSALFFFVGCATVQYGMNLPTPRPFFGKGKAVPL